MPHLHLDTPNRYPAARKRELAKKLGNLYAEIMQTTPDLVDVTVRELGEGSVWRCSADDPVPTSVLSAEIRRGRPPEQRARLAEALIGACVETLQVDPLFITVEFTQHTGDEIYKKVLVNGELRGGLGRDWSPTEVTAPLIESMRAEAAQRE